MDFGLTLLGIAYIIAFVIPGLIFKRFYYQGKFSKQFFEGLFVDRLLTNILWGLVIQLLTIVSYCLFFGITSKDLYHEINSIYNNYTQQRIPEFKFSYIQHMMRYLFAATLSAAALGIGLHLLVRFMKIDIRFSIFRFSNQWHYYFTGESLWFKEFRNNAVRKNIKILSTEVDVVVKDNDGRTNMFSGTLRQYTLSKSGELETIYLTDAKRFSTKTNPGALKTIPGDCFVIPYSNVLNLNLRYNAATKDRSTRRLLKSLFIGMVLSTTILSFFVAIIYPWFVAPGFGRKLASCVVLTVAWFNMMNVVLSWSATDNKDAPLKSRSAKIFSLLFAISLALWGLVIAKTITWDQLYGFIKIWERW